VATKALKPVPSGRGHGGVGVEGPGQISTKMASPSTLTVYVVADDAVGG
jgi:hypothetical protein